MSAKRGIKTNAVALHAPVPQISYQTRRKRDAEVGAASKGRARKRGAGSTNRSRLSTCSGLFGCDLLLTLLKLSLRLTGIREVPGIFANSMLMASSDSMTLDAVCLVARFTASPAHLAWVSGKRFEDGLGMGWVVEGPSTGQQEADPRPFCLSWDPWAPRLPQRRAGCPGLAHLFGL